MKDPAFYTVGSPDEVRSAANVIRRLVCVLEEKRRKKMWWQLLFWDFPLADLRWTADRLEETARVIELELACTDQRGDA
jgi:hypothetical protein